METNAGREVDSVGGVGEGVVEGTVVGGRVADFVLKSTSGLTWLMWGQRRAVLRAGGAEGEEEEEARGLERTGDDGTSGDSEGAEGEEDGEEAIGAERTGEEGDSEDSDGAEAEGAGVGDSEGAGVGDGGAWETGEDEGASVEAKEKEDGGGAEGEDSAHAVMMEDRTERLRLCSVM